jgi:hypothetical protein
MKTADITKAREVINTNNRIHGYNFLYDVDHEFIGFTVYRREIALFGNIPFYKITEQKEFTDLDVLVNWANKI